jgi:hypothetical protein
MRLSVSLIAAPYRASMDVSAAFAGRQLGSLRVLAIVQVTTLALIVIRVLAGISPSGLTRRRQAGYAGRLNQNRVWPSAESAPTRPPLASMSCFTIASPIPAPPRAWSRDFSTR